MTTTTDLNVETYNAERRHIAKRMPFPAEFAPYIDWESIARTARELGAHIDARYSDRGACTITFWWELTDND